MTTVADKFEAERLKYMTMLQRRNDNFQNHCIAFLDNSNKKLLVIEMGSLLLTVSSVNRILSKLEGDLKQQYGKEENQMILNWSQLRSITDAVEVLPKLPNLLILEFDKMTMDEQDVKMSKKLMEWISNGTWQKVIVITQKRCQKLINSFECIDSKTISTLEEQEGIVKMNEIPRSKSRLKPKTKSLIDAASEGYLKEVIFFIENGADIDKSERGWTALHKAAVEGYSRIVLKLLEHGAKHLPCRGRSILYEAAEKGQNQVVIILLEHGVDVNIKLFNGWTPLHSACLKGHNAVVKTLLEYNADIEETQGHIGHKGHTGLHIAASKGHTDVVETLLAHGAEVDVRDWDGNTPLLLTYDLGIMKILVERYHANINFKNRRGETVLGMAKIRNNNAIIKYLTSKGAL